MAYRQERENYRKGSFKQSIDADDTKRRRAENQQTVRKNKRTEQLNKKRNFGPASQTPQVKLTIAELQNSIAKLPQYADDLRSEVYGRRFEAVFALRQLLSIEVDPPINQVANAGIIPLLVNILNNDPDAKIQFEAAWALTNVASGNSEQTALLIRQNAVQAFISKITHPSEITVKEQCVWALGNIAGDSHLCRDYILHEDVLQLLLKETGEEVKTSLRRNAVWTISNLCRGKPTPPFEKVAIAIPVLAELIKSADANVVTDACWALSYLSDGDNTRINTLLQHNVCETVVTLLNHNSTTVQTPALRVIGNIVTGDDIQTEAAIQCGCLPALKYMLDNNPKKSIKREVCWTLSNITAGTISQIQHVLNAGIAESLINHMKFAEFDVRKEAAWAIANATSSGNIHQIKSLVEKGCILPLCELVKAPDVRVVAVSLEGLENILERGEHLRASREDGENPFVLVIEECGGLEHIERLATHPNPSIFNKAKDLLEKFFGLEDNDQNTAPNIASDGQAYNFSTNTDATGLSF